jgi:hypothetical protein
MLNILHLTSSVKLTDAEDKQPFSCPDGETEVQVRDRALAISPDSFLMVPV